MQDNKNKSAVSFVVDLESGEIFNEIYEGDLVKIFRKEQLEHLQKYKVINENNLFIKIIRKSSDMLAKENLTASENSIIWAMQNNIGYGAFSGYLIKVQCNMFYGFLNQAELKAKTNLAQRTFDGAIKGLIDKKIITIEKVGRENRILVNPFIFMSGKETTTYLYNKFKNTKWNYLGQ